MKLFDPGPFSFGDIASVELVATRKHPQGVLATYRLSPRDVVLFRSKIGAVPRERFGQPYGPVPGLISTLTVLPDQDDFGFVVALARSHGTALMSAATAFGELGGSLVDQSMIRALLRGYLHEAGV